MNQLIRHAQFFLAPHKRHYVAGMAMATPFAAGMLPAPWMLLTLIIGIPLVLHLVRHGVHPPKIGRIPLAVWLVVLLGLIHVYGLWVGPTPYWKRVLLDMAVVATGIAVFLIGQRESDGQGEMLRGFFAALIPAAIAFAALGLIKAALLDRGFLLGFIYDRYHDQYPWGSSLRDDYSLFSLSLIIAGLGLVIRTLKENRSRMHQLYAMIALALVISCGMLTPARRFAVVSLLIPALWLVVGLHSIPRRLLAEKVFLPMASVTFLVASICWITQGETQNQNFEVLYLSSPSYSYTRSADGNIETYPAADKMLDTFRENHKSVFYTRTEKWRMGKDLLAGHTWLIGMGFAYHDVFSCGHLDYPHFPILSEWLVGGIAGAAVAVAIYFLLFQSVWRSGWEGVRSGSSAIALAVLPYSMFSGDTLFSIPQFIIVCLLAQSQVESGAHAIGNDPS